MLISSAKLNIMNGILQQRDPNMSNGELGPRSREAEIEQRNPFLRGLGKKISYKTKMYSCHCYVYIQWLHRLRSFQRMAM